jgi:hypothetical protein
MKGENMKPTISELQSIIDNPDGVVEIAPDGSVVSSDFRKELTAVLNKHSKETASNTPDFILAKFLIICLHAFDVSTNEREAWHGRKQEAV